MRKLTAIVLILVLAFNWYGYRMLLQYLDSRNNNNLQLKLDHGQYDLSDLMELHVPLNLPYISDSRDFQDYSGETVVNGHHYRFVKRKLVNNELVLLCVRDNQKDRLKKAGIEFFKQVNDTPGSEKKSKTPVKAVKGLVNEFTFSQLEFLPRLWVGKRNTYPRLNESLPSISPATPIQPPNT